MDFSSESPDKIPDGDFHGHSSFSAEIFLATNQPAGKMQTSISYPMLFLLHDGSFHYFMLCCNENRLPVSSF